MTGRPLPDDAALGDLALLFPAYGAPGFVAEAISAGAGVPIDAAAATVEYVRWRPGRGCTVLWSFPQPGGSPMHAAGELVAHGGTRLELEVFPIDDGLPGLTFAADADHVGHAVGVELARAVPVAYKPRRRCVLRYLDAAGSTRFYGKVFKDDRGAPMPAWIAELRCGLSARGTSWELPVPAAYVAGVRLLLFEAVQDAVELARLVLGDQAGRARALTAVAQAAEGLAEFRCLPVDGVGTVTAQEILRPLERGRRQLEPVLAEVARTVGARVRDLAVLAAELPPEPPALSHGAFRVEQLLVRGEGIVVLDLDSLCLSGPGADPGCFLAGLDLTASHSPALRPLLAACEATFLEALERTALVDPRWLAWHRAAACVENALRCAYALDVDWPDRTALLLEQAAAALLTPTTV